MGVKLLWTAVTVFLVAEAYSMRNSTGVVAVLFFASAIIAIVGCIMVWLGK
jgi:hypothetical protein